MWHFEKCRLEQLSDRSRSESDEYTESRMEKNVFKGVGGRHVVSPHYAGQFIHLHT